jgi:molybdopterin molybdotransferase
MMTVCEARAAMLACAGPLGQETAGLDDAMGRVLAKAVSAWRDQPPFAVSAMDGYAVRAGDTPGTLTVGGESAAGRGFAGECGPGCAIRISTGAALPRNADTVVMQEDVQRTGLEVAVPALRLGQNVRPQGGDFRAGEQLLSVPRILDGISISLAAAAGLAQLEVMRRPRVAILSSGDELAPPGTHPGAWQIFDSATFGIAGLVQGWGGRAERLALERDHPDAIAAAADRSLRDADLLVVIGGASVGDHDHARPALAKLGLRAIVEKVSVRPGKPTWFGTVEGRPVLGLPGNPASALVCAQLFLKPLLHAMLGLNTDPDIRRARLIKPLAANGAREHYMRARWSFDEQGQLWVEAFAQQDSSLISVFAASNALIGLPANAAARSAGTLVDILPLDLP